ncbi:hypothetical protein TcG_06623 [Trypanosoma cruzi]|nr:hypothetical protein TcG_06623 [Trypanosoma cruzi]
MAAAHGGGGNIEGVDLEGLGATLRHYFLALRTREFPLLRFLADVCEVRPEEFSPAANKIGEGVTSFFLCDPRAISIFPNFFPFFFVCGFGSQRMLWSIFASLEH